MTLTSGKEVVTLQAFHDANADPFVGEQDVADAEDHDRHGNLQKRGARSIAPKTTELVALDQTALTVTTGLFS